MKSRLLIALAVFYGAVAIITFGHGAAYASRQHIACEARSDRLHLNAFCPDDSPISGMGAAVLWPLYWSWEAWS